MSSLNVEEQEDPESRSLSRTCKDADADNSHVDEITTKTDEKSENPRNQTQPSIKYKMYLLCRELCFLLMIVFTYAAFHNNAPKISKSPTAFPFFSAGSLVKDWYSGQLSEAIELASESDLAFVMYYAPWDAESQAVRHEFNVAAQHMHKYVHFAAINCWQPGSECRSQYSKVYSWPVLMAYPAHGRGIQYRGPRKAEHMIAFLQSVAKPLIRVDWTQIGQYQALYDAVVVGYVDARLGSPYYGAYYSAALRFLERDPFRDVPFLVLTQAGSPSNHLDLHLWNETLMYHKTDKDWRPESIVSWISDNLHQVSVWASPPGGKSQSLSSYLQPGPALILFTPRNPLYKHTDFYTVLHDVALNYHNCDYNVVANVKRTLRWLLRKDYALIYKNLKSKCLSSKKAKKDKFPTVITYDYHKLWLNNTCEFAKSGAKTEKKSSLSCAATNFQEESCMNIVHSFVPVLNKGLYTDQEKRPSEKTKEEEEIHNMKKGPSGDGDFRSPENLERASEWEQCRFFRIAHHLQPANFAPLSDHMDNKDGQISGLACTSNLSLSIVALDSLQYYHFAEGLGIDLFSRDDQTAVVILNPALETHHVMNQPYSATNLQQFIAEFSKNALARTLSSTTGTRFQYGVRGPCIQQKSVVADNNTCVQELSTANFLPAVLQPDVAVVVLYHSLKCAFCSGVSHALLTVARLLGPIQRNLLFARIDGDIHALPWEFSMHHYPSILFFPAKRKSESRVFPQNVPITVSNILSFILANVEPHMKLRLMWTLCKQKAFPQDMEQCTRTMRSECTKLVGQLLRLYRFSADVYRRPALLQQLQHLRSLYFLLANAQDTASIDRHIAHLRSLHAFHTLHPPLDLKRSNVSQRKDEL